MKKLSKILFIASLLMFIVICNGCRNNTALTIDVENLDIAALEKYAEEGNADAQVELGYLYYNGERGINKDYTEAVKWLQKAVDKKNIYAKYLLGVCYDEGNGIDENYAMANTLYKEAFTEFSRMADTGDAKAQFFLGECYDFGRATDKNEKLAYEAYEKSAEQGYTRAQFRLADFCNVLSPFNAVKWYRLAAEKKYAHAQFKLGVCYENGFDVTQSYTEAMKWYRLAAEQGYTLAQYALGDCYEKGEGVEQSHYEAAKWYRLAAEQGYDLAQCKLGVYYMDGKGIKQSKEEAIKWFRKAAEQGNKLAILYLKKFGIYDY